MNLRRVWVLALLGAIAFPYLRSPIYRFDDPRPFAGSHVYNPYAGTSGRWQRANLHAHARAWGGLTSGEQSTAEVVASYRNLGYDVPGISNYQQIAAQTPPVYEHGYNISKRHQLAIGARSVDWFDLPLWQGLSHEQYVIDRLRDTADLVALVHPHTRDAYTLDDMRQLTGYHLLEIVNGPFRSESPWDAALSSGHAVWGLGNDDTHDTADVRRTAAGWTMIDAPAATTPDIVAGLRAGRAYVAARNGDTPAPFDVELASAAVEGETLTVTTRGALSTFTFIGQNGSVRQVVKDAMSASYTLDARDSYVRTIVKAPATTLYLNPVLRHDGRGLPVLGAQIDLGQTWLVRAIWAGVALFAAWLLRDRRADARAATRSIENLAQTDRETA